MISHPESGWLADEGLRNEDLEVILQAARDQESWAGMDVLQKTMVDIGIDALFLAAYIATGTHER